MDDLPNNSTRAKRKEEPPREKLKSVTQGEVIKRKKPLGRRFKELFVGGDSRSVWGYVAMDVIVPAIKDTFADAVSEGVNRMLFGDSGSHRRRSYRSNSAPGYVQYGRSSSSSSSRAPWAKDPRDEPRRSISRQARAEHNFDEILLERRDDAEEVIDRMTDLIEKYQQATVSDLYDLVDITGNYTDEKWGWYDLRGAGVSRVREGFLLNLPKPEPLNG